MSSIRLINKIYFYPKLCCDIVQFYDKRNISYEKLDRDTFHKICRSHYIDRHPSVLFDYFDKAGIRTAIIPVEYGWSYRIYHDDTITIMNDYNNRLDATLAALEYSVTIYNSLNPSENTTQNENENNQ